MSAYVFIAIHPRNHCMYECNYMSSNHLHV